MAGANARTIHELLLGWYAQNARGLPWRDTRDPYAILVAEVMLQQTQVTRVLPKFQEFLGRFPTFAALASATRAEVIRSWAPLGYNLRAIRLHDAARRVVANGGALPSDPGALVKFPGLGRYTAAAIACFAYGHELAVVDTNVGRVVVRVFLGERDARHFAATELWALARRVLPASRAYDWNQALMDLGATVCTARQPACIQCPLENVCRARGSFSCSEPLLSAAVRESRSPYEVVASDPSSRRLLRGRLIQLLRELPGAECLPLNQAARTLRPIERDGSWLLPIAEGLARDGLAEFCPGPAGEAHGDTFASLGLRLPLEQLAPYADTENAPSTVEAAVFWR